MYILASVFEKINESTFERLKIRVVLGEFVAF